uniref:Uncharacterized protein n=1 Tax=Plectus sambesii TaxID=2011161 RepID=A0A914XN00_9BILA
MQVQISRACAQGALVRIGEKRGRYTHVDLLSQYERLGLRLNDVEGSCEPPLLASNGYSSEERPMRLTCLESIELDPIKHQSSNSPQGSKGLDYAAGPPDANHNNVRSLSLCDICRRPAAMNLAGISESFLVCSECSAKAHPSCLNYSEELTDNCRKGDWQCSECKTCMMCASAEEEPENNVLLFCDFCDRACHMLCNRVPLTLKPLGKWMCDWCAASARRNKSSPNKKPTCPAKLIQDSDRDIAHNYGQANAFPSCECSANSVMRDLSSDAIMTKSVEKLEGWSADRVSSFLTDLGFQAEAFVFKEQDIDGHALLLLTRDDIVGRMSFKLGPALRIHRYVFALQTAYSRAHRV